MYQLTDFTQFYLNCVSACFFLLNVVLSAVFRIPGDYLLNISKLSILEGEAYTYHMQATSCEHMHGDTSSYLMLLVSNLCICTEYDLSNRSPPLAKRFDDGNKHLL